MRGTRNSAERFRLFSNLYTCAFGWFSDASFGQKLDFGSLKSPLNPVLNSILVWSSSDEAMIVRFMSAESAMSRWVCANRYLNDGFTGLRVLGYCI